MSVELARTAPRLDGAPPRRGLLRYADLEGYRGLAALAVVLYHVHQHVETNGIGGATAGGTGLQDRFLEGLDSFVDLFFVLSAFLLTVPYARAALAGRVQPSTRAFLVRRAARIVPLYLLAVSMVWAFRNPVLPGDLVDLVEHLLFVQVYDPKRLFFTIGPAWSLAVEVQFYLLLAVVGSAVCVLASRIEARLRLRLLVGVVLGAAAASILWRVLAWYVLHLSASYWPAWFGLEAKLDTFACGMFLAVLAAKDVHLSARAVVVARSCGVGVVAFAFWSRPYLAGPHVWFHLIVAVGFTLLLAPSVLAPQDRWSRIMASPVPAFLGLVSYSLYLWHEPVLLALAAHGALPSAMGTHAVLKDFLVLTLAAVPVAWVSYRMIEKPFGNLKLLVDRDGRARDYYDGR